MNKLGMGLGGAVALAGIGLVVVLTDTDTSGFLLNPDSAPVVAMGRLLYQEHCASCHGADLKGQSNWQDPLDNGRLPAPPHDEDGHTWHHSEQMLLEIMKLGVQKFAGEDYETDMPAYGEVLTDSEIIAVLSYIKSEWPVEIRQRHDQMSAVENVE